MRRRRSSGWAGSTTRASRGLEWLQTWPPTTMLRRRRGLACCIGFALSIWIRFVLRPCLCVNSRVPPHVGHDAEASSAAREGALERFLARVGIHMYLEAAWTIEALLTVWTFIPRGSSGGSRSRSLSGRFRGSKRRRLARRGIVETSRKSYCGVCCQGPTQ